MNLELSIVPIWDLIECTTAEFRLQAQNKNMSIDVVMKNMNNKNYPEEASHSIEMLSSFRRKGKRSRFEPTG